MGGRRSDDRGDSSTIGVVLMVGIAVVLAAVAFGTFSGIGTDNLAETPNAQFDVSFDQGGSGGFTQADQGDGEAIVVTHEQGDTIKWPFFHVKVDGTPVRDTGGLEFNFSAGPPTEIGSGDSVRITNSGGGNVIKPGAEILVTYENPNTEKTVVLIEAEVP
jgi:flagellin-like protein